MTTQVKAVSGWGRYPVQVCELERPERYAGLHSGADSLIARGQGRSYGDAALNERRRVLLTERVNRLLEFDSGKGILRAEAGATLAEILDVIVPKGWFLPVTPGTKFVSLGGCVASDVHGKNHHRDGSFGDHVICIELIGADGSRVTCSPDHNRELFWATVGGMGLTGVIGEVTLRLMPISSPRMIVRNHAAADLEQLLALLANPATDDRYAVAWVDSLARGRNFGRGIAMCAHHAAADELPEKTSSLLVDGPERSRAMRFDLPGWVLNRVSVGLFNELYYRHHRGKKLPFVTGFDSYFYPLDSIGHWNRLYGKHGFVQYQCVIPDHFAFDGIRALLQDISRTGCVSFLAVVKRLGPQGKGLLSFPMAGYTLALDLPIRDGRLFALLDRLDDSVARYGGRVYLAKDARLSPASFRAMYPRYGEWLKIKKAVDPHNRFDSSLSRRLGMGGNAA